MLISEVEPINNIGRNLLNHSNAEAVIDTIIELPLRKACKIFKNKNIETVMSSANKNNLLKPGEKSTEKEDIKDKFLFYPPPNFEDAGKGYAWIMLNFDTLSNENKDILFELENKKSKEGLKIGEKAIWFVRSSILRNLEYQLKTGELDYYLARQAQSENEIAIPHIEIDERYVKFNEKRIILAYNNRYPDNTVILRKPINANSTTEEVEEFFVKFAEIFKEQKLIKDNSKSLDEKANER